MIVVKEGKSHDNNIDKILLDKLKYSISEKLSSPIEIVVRDGKSFSSNLFVVWNAS